MHNLCRVGLRSAVASRVMSYRFLAGLTATLILTVISADSATLQVEHFANTLTLHSSEAGLQLSSWSWEQNELSEGQGFSINRQRISSPTGRGGSSFAFDSIGSNDLRLGGYQQTTFAAQSGATVTLNLQNFALTGHSTLSLFGDATSTFVINVTNQFSLAQRSRILLSGGIQWDHVFFNVLGTGRVVSLNGKSILSGTLTAAQRTLWISGHAIAYGEVSADKIIFRQAAQVIIPPIVSQ